MAKGCDNGVCLTTMIGWFDWLRQASFYDSAGLHSDPLFYSFPERYRVAYAAELDHFTDVLSGKSHQLLVTAKDTLSAVKVANACEESFKQGKPIDIK